MASATEAEPLPEPWKAVLLSDTVSLDEIRKLVNVPAGEKRQMACGGGGQAAPRTGSTDPSRTQAATTS